MKPSSVAVLIAGVCFVVGWVLTFHESTTPQSLSLAYFFLGAANLCFSQV